MRLSIMVSVVVCALAAPSVAGAAQQFSEQASGSYSLYGNTVTGTGQISGRTPIAGGSATFWLDCNSASGSATFTSGADSISLSFSGVPCSAASSGPFTITGGTGAYEYAYGSGTFSQTNDRYSAFTLDAQGSFAGQGQTLTVNKTGSGDGTVVSSPTGIDCGATCSAQFRDGTSVTLTASAASGSTFAGWTGCDVVNGSQCTVSISADRSVTASFAVIQRTLTVDKSGPGVGSVTSSPAGIECGATCSAQFRDGTSVTLTASAASGSTLAGWTRCDSVADDQCTVALSADRTVTARFAKIQTTPSDTSSTTTPPSTQTQSQASAPDSPGSVAQQDADPLPNLSIAVTPTVASAVANVARALAREKVGQLLQSGAFLASLGFTPGQFVSGSSLDAGVKLLSTRGRVVLATGHRTVTKSGRITITAKLTPTGRKLLKAAKKAHRGLTATLQIQVTPRLNGRSGKAANRSKSVKLKR